jgi:hypothetical protein
MTVESFNLAGLCASCTHSKAVHSSKGSTFIQCRLSFTDPRFARYPQLPVLRCDGYRAASDPGNGS